MIFNLSKVEVGIKIRLKNDQKMESSTGRVLTRSRRLQDAQRRLQDAARRAQGATRCAQDAPRCAQDAPRCAQDALRRFHDASKTRQDAPKTRPRRPKDAPKRAQNAPRAARRSKMLPRRVYERFFVDLLMPKGYHGELPKRTALPVPYQDRFMLGWFYEPRRLQDAPRRAKKRS